MMVAFVGNPYPCFLFGELSFVSKLVPVMKYFHSYARHCETSAFESTFPSIPFCHTLCIIHTQSELKWMIRISTFG